MQKRLGRPPGPLLERPELTANNIYYWLAYCELSKRYPVGAIPPTEIVATADICSLGKVELFVKINAIEDALHGDNGSTTASGDKG